MQKNYEINNDTLVLIPINTNKTKIVEKGQEIIIDKNIMDIIENSCRYFGSSYRGRCIGTKNLIGMTYKIPIIIEEYKEIVFFPTISPKQDDCCWISLNNIENYNKFNNNINILFKNNYSLNLNISYGSFENQLYRATRLLMVLKKRKEC